MLNINLIIYKMKITNRGNIFMKQILILLIGVNFLSHEILVACGKMQMQTQLKTQTQTQTKMETIASFMSNYKMIKGKGALKKSGSENHSLLGSTNLNKNLIKKTHTNLQTNVHNTNDDLPGSEIKKTEDDLPDIPVYYQGWVKYFRYAESTGEKPSKFFRNSAFDKQTLDGEDEKDEYGSKKIPSEKHFFLVVYKDTANILTSRENPLMQINDSLIIDFVKKIPENNNFAGGIKDFGKFSEGSCFEVLTIKPGAFFQMSAKEIEPSKGLSEVWLICSDDDAQKQQMMNILIKLKLRKQHKLGVYESTAKKGKKPKPEPTVADMIGGNMEDPENLNDPNRKSTDGYWMILQNWTPCTLKCGGGLSYLQLMCVPPKDGGKPCDGEAIRTRPCNPQPCPQINEVKSLIPKMAQGGGSNSTNVMEKPIVKMMPISTRPQRYDKCYLKDTDALLVKLDESSGYNVKIPIRLVMNNKSVAVYQDETLHTNLMTFLLKNTVFTKSMGDDKCFILNGLNTKAQFCQLDAQGGNFVQEWDYDFNLFKTKCKQKREKIELDEEEEEKLKKDYKDKLNNLKMEMVEQKAKKVKRQVESKEEVKMEKQIEQAQSMTYMAMQKELKLEEMLEKEEAEREREEQEELRVQIDGEKKKNECLTKSIEEKELEDQAHISEANAEETIQKIKEDAKKQIIAKRNEIKKKISMMKMKNKRKLAQMQNEIINLRTVTAEKVHKYAKVGDMKKCFNPAGQGDTVNSQIDEYCQVNFPDNIGKMIECQAKDSFCFVCCESEFGEMHLADREKCYKTVCEVDPNAKKSEAKDN